MNIDENTTKRHKEKRIRTILSDTNSAKFFKRFKFTSDAKTKREEK
jgi:hypothetical protein